MSLRWFFRPDWVNTHAATEITDNVRLYTLDVTENAEEGSVAVSTILVDDDEGALDIPPLTQIWATETEIAASSNTYVYIGQIAERTYHRGDSARTSAARIIEVNAADLNFVFTRRVFSSGNSNRPRETDVQRVLWVCNNADGEAMLDDTTFVSTASPVTMDANDYRGQTAMDVLNDCAQASGKNFYAYYREGIGTSVWYGAEDLTTHTSMVRLTNVLGDIDNNLTFPISEDTQLVRDPSRLVSGVYFQGSTPQTTVFVRNLAMEPFITVRNQVHSNANVRTMAQAQSRANRYLADNDSEDDRITTSVRLPAAKVNWIKAGMRVQFKASHLPGYQTDYVWMRVLRRSVAQESETHYLLRLELGTNTVPASPSENPNPITTILAADLSIGSAIYGYGGRTQHFATEVGGSMPPMVAGRQYRLVATVIDTYNLDLCDPGAGRHYDSMNAPGATIHDGAEGTPVGSPAHPWTDQPANTNLFIYAGGPNFTMQAPVYVGGTAPADSYGPAQVLTTGWATQTTNVTAADISISGSPISGFCGGFWVVHLALQERLAP